MSNYSIIKNDCNLCINEIKRTFTKEQRAERLRQLNHIKKWARRNKKDIHEVLYFNTYDEILQREAYEQLTRDYYSKFPFLANLSDDDDDY